MPSYQDVVAANGAVGAWALVEAAGADFAPYIGAGHMTGQGSLVYQQTGPFATSVAVKGNTAGYLTLPFPNSITTPWWVEFWAKITSPPGSDVSLSRSGNAAGGNGAGLYVHTDGHLHFQVVGPRDVDTGKVIDSNWHLYQYGHTDSTGVSVQVVVDGVVDTTVSLAGIVNANPATWGFLSDAVGVQIAPSASLSYVALYPAVLTPQNAYASFLAATDPTTAMLYAKSPSQIGTTALLNLIYAAVHKTW